MARKLETLIETIYRCCDNKAKVVVSDEREAGIRAILNLGHTFGHAIETAQGYGEWLHGEAVSAGIMLAANLSLRKGWLNTQQVSDIKQLLISAKLPVEPPDMTCKQFLSIMAVDKKVLDGQLRLVLLKSIGEAVVTSEIETADVLATLKDLGVE